MQSKVTHFHSLTRDQRTEKVVWREELSMERILAYEENETEARCHETK